MRLTDPDLTARVRAYATRCGLTFSSALAALVRSGLARVNATAGANAGTQDERRARAQRAARARWHRD